MNRLLPIKRRSTRMFDVSGCHPPNTESHMGRPVVMSWWAWVFSSHSSAGLRGSATLSLASRSARPINSVSEAWILVMAAS